MINSFIMATLGGQNQLNLQQGHTPTLLVGEISARSLASWEVQL